MKKNPANYCVLSDQTKDDRKIKKCKPASSHTKREIFTWQKERAAAGFKDMLFLSANSIRLFRRLRQVLNLHQQIC